MTQDEGCKKDMVEELCRKFSAKQLWNMTITERRGEHHNLCLIFKLLIMSIPGSNSTTEGAFPTLKTILSDRKLSLKPDGIVDIRMTVVKTTCGHNNDVQKS